MKISGVCAVTLLMSMGACAKKESTARSVYTNCKLPIADGRGGVALGGFPRYTDRLRSTGTVTATVILVDFPDSAATKTPDEALAFISGATATFTEMSYGKLQYVLSPRKHWYRMSKASSQYSLGTSAEHRAYIQEAVNLADADVDFSTTDSLIILSNPDTTGLGEAGPAYVASAGVGITADNHEMLNAVTSAHDLNTWGSIWLNHEVTHTLGLVDLYAYVLLNPSTPSYDDLLRFSGEFSYMGLNSFSSHAPGLTAWERWVLGWIEDEQVTCTNPLTSGKVTVELTPLSSSTGMKAAVVPVGSTKAIVVESRRASGIDARIAKEGALVYTVDSSVQSGKGPLQVYPVSASDPRYLQAPRAVGESVSVEGFKVEVLTSSASGDTIAISAE